MSSVDKDLGLDVDVGERYWVIAEAEEDMQKYGRVHSEVYFGDYIEGRIFASEKEAYQWLLGAGWGVLDDKNQVLRQPIKQKGARE